MGRDQMLIPLYDGTEENIDVVWDPLYSASAIDVRHTVDLTFSHVQNCRDCVDVVLTQDIHEQIVIRGVEDGLDQVFDVLSLSQWSLGHVEVVVQRGDRKGRSQVDVDDVCCPDSSFETVNLIIDYQ